MNSGSGSAPSAIGARGADALQSADEGGQEVRGHPPRCTVRGTDISGTTRYISTLTCTYTCFRMPSRPGGGASTGRTRAGRPGDARTPGLAAVVPTRRRYGPYCPYPAPVPTCWFPGLLLAGATSGRGGSCLGGGALRQHVDAFRLDAQSGCQRHGSSLLLQRLPALPRGRGARVLEGQEYRARLTSCPRM
jgi:hypothetical protein